MYYPRLAFLIWQYHKSKKKWGFGFLWMCFERALCKQPPRSGQCCFGMPLKTWLARDLPKLKTSAHIKYDSPVYCDYFSSAGSSVIPSHCLWLLESRSPCFPPAACPPSGNPGRRRVSFNSLVLPLLPFISLSAFLSPPDNKFDFYLSSPTMSWNAKMFSQKG